MKNNIFIQHPFLNVLWGVIVLFGLYLTSLYSYLLFHSIIEILTVIVAFGIFAIAWNCRRLLDNDYLLFLGIAYLFVGCIDLIHTLAYKGMGVFPGFGANLPTQLWIAARYLQGVSFLIAPLFLSRKLNLYLAFTSYFLIVCFLLITIFHWRIFPDCFVEGVGLTAFKKTSEYIISIMLLVSIGILLKEHSKLEHIVLNLLIWSIVFLIASSLAFTFYISVYGLSNLIGHIFKIIAFYIIYKSIIVTGLTRPYDILFRDLKQSEENLKKSNIELENQVTEKARIITDLQNALAQVKILKGLLPICAHCKKIRDDQGYWNNVEKYLRDRSEVEFSHGICPDCRKKHYPSFIRGEEPLEKEKITAIVRGKRRILIMDGDETVREVISKLLEKLGYETAGAKDILEAIDLCKQAKESNQPFATAILDLTVLGGMGGKEAVEQLLVVDPQIKAIATSGYSDDPIMTDFPKYGFSRVISKPYKMLELSKVLHQLINE